MKAYLLLLLTLVGTSLCPNYACTPVYAETAETPSTITITPTGLDSCEVVSNLDVQASYSLTNPDPSKLSTGDYLPNNSVATYSLEGLVGINITGVSFSAKSSNNTVFDAIYVLNDGASVTKHTGFQALGGSLNSKYVDLAAPFDYPISEVELFEFSIKVTSGYFNVQSLTITIEEAMDPFAKAMLSDLSCDASGVTPPSGEEWNAAMEAFETLSAEEQVKYQNAVADSEGDTYQRVAAKYDYVLSKYGTEKYENFLGRAVKGTNAVANYDVLNFTVLVGVVAIVAITAAFLIFAQKGKKVM